MAKLAHVSMQKLREETLENDSSHLNEFLYDDKTDSLTSLGEEDFVPVRPPVAVAVGFLLAYGLIIVAAFIGNTFVILLLCKKFKFRAVTDLFLVWLAVGDILVAGVNMPLQLFTIIHPEWTLGEPACKFKEYFQCVTIISSVLTLSAVAFDRYLAICHPLAMRGVHTNRYAAIIIIFIWLTSCLVSVPQILISVVDSSRLVRNEEGKVYRLGSFCTEDFAGAKMHQRLYSVLTYVFFYVLPVLVIVLAYGAVIRVLWSSKSFSDETQTQANLRTRQKRRLIKMLLALVVAFVICWFPFFTATLIRSLNKAAMRSMAKSRLHAILQLVGYANTCANPVIYTFMSPRMRKNLQELFANKSGACCGKKEDKTQRSQTIASRNTQQNCVPDTTAGKSCSQIPLAHLKDTAGTSGKIYPCSVGNVTKSPVNVQTHPVIQTNVYVVRNNPSQKDIHC